MHRMAENTNRRSAVYVELLESGMAQDPDTAHDFLGRIKKEAMRMTNLVDDILMISRLESRGAKADIVTIRTVELLEDSLSSIAAQARRAHHSP